MQTIRLDQAGAQQRVVRWAIKLSVSATSAYFEVSCFVLRALIVFKHILAPVVRRLRCAIFLLCRFLYEDEIVGKRKALGPTRVAYSREWYDGRYRSILVNVYISLSNFKVYFGPWRTPLRCFNFGFSSFLFEIDSVEKYQLLGPTRPLYNGKWFHDQ